LHFEPTRQYRVIELHDVLASSSNSLARFFQTLTNLIARIVIPKSQPNATMEFIPFKTLRQYLTEGLEEFVVEKVRHPVEARSYLGC
jgi:hypothetical protein